MNQYQVYRLKIRLLSGNITPWHSDTLFGAFCWALAYLQGEKKLAEFLAEYQRGRAQVIFSNGFPGNLLPKPVFGLVFKQQNLQTKAEKLATIKAGKRRKKAAYLSMEEFRRYQQGELADIEVKEEPFIKYEVYHNQVDRELGTTGGTGSLYSQTEWLVRSGEMSVYLKISMGFEEEVRQAFEILGRIGLGKKRSLGKGCFEIKEFQPCPELAAVSNANAFVLFSNCVPAQGDPVDGYYKTIVKYGKTEADLVSSPFKRPVFMLTPGSIFWANGEVKPFYGRMLDNLTVDSRILHYGLGFSVPICLNRV